MRWWMAGVVLLCSCQESGPAVEAPPEPDLFYSPQGIAASDRYILVANSAVHFEGNQIAWESGFVTVIERKTRRIIKRIHTTHFNPQNVAVDGDRAYVVSGGKLSLAEDGLVTMVSAGGVDVLDLEGEPRRSHNIYLGDNEEDRRIGAYGSIALSPDGRYAFIGSGTRGDLFKVDLDQREVLRGPEHPIALFSTPATKNGLTVVRAHGDGLAVLNYNTDELCLSEDLAGDLGQRSCGTVGVQDKLVEGPIDLARAPDGRSLVLMTIANGLYRVDTSRSPFEVDHGFAKTGLANNRVLVHDRYAYILNSMSNNLQRIDLESGQSDLPFAVLPVKSNPYDMVITSEAEGDVAWITLYGWHQLAVVSLQSGEVLALLPGKEGTDLGPPDASIGDVGDTGDAGSCTHSPQVVGIGNVIAVSYGSGSGQGQDRMPQVIQGGPHGSGSSSGSTEEVLSLGMEGEIVVDFGDHVVIDGPGADLIVFENPFLVSDYNPYAEPAVVALSATDTDPSSFIEFPCDLSVTEGDPAQKTWPYPGCAGIRPVLANPDQCVLATDPAVAGGDAFDLADVGLERARYLRIRDAGLSPLGETSKGFDLDAVVLINYKNR